MNVINVAWSFVSVNYEGTVGNIVYTGNIKGFLGLQGWVFASAQGGEGTFVSWEQLANGGYSGRVPVAGLYVSQVQAAGEVAFALTLVAAVMSFVAAVTAIQRFFENTAFPKLVGATSAFIAFVVSVAAFSNWHVNGYLKFRDNAFGTVVGSNEITNYEYYGFNVVIVGWVFSLVTFTLHVAAPTGGSTAGGSAGGEKAVEVA